MRNIIAVINDLHGGHRLGLMNPDVELQREDECGTPEPFQPQPTASQVYLWELYQHHLGEVRTLAGEAPITLLVNGDAVQGNKHPGHWVSTRLSDQILIGAANLAPWFDLPNLREVIFNYGTEAHNFGEGSGELLLQALLAALYPRVHVTITPHGLLTRAQVTMDHAHHGPHPGSRNWLAGNVARFYLRDLMYREILAHRRPPDVILRAHYHTPVHEVLETGGYTSQLFVVPGYCMIDDHGMQATRSIECATHGMLVLVCEDGQVTPHRLYDTIDMRTDEAEYA